MALLETFKELDTKQKITGVVTVVLLAFLLYLGYDTFFKGEPTSPALATAKPVVSESKPATGATPALVTPTETQETADEQSLQLPPQSSVTSATSIQEPLAQNTPLDNQNLPFTSVAKQESEGPSPEQLAFLQQSKEMQREYLKLVNEFQLAQLQQKLESTKSEIAKARLESIVSGAKQQELESELEKKGQQVSALSIGAAAGAAAAQNELEVVYVGQRAGEWRAMLSQGSGYFEVHVGTRLNGGWKVIEISDKGVILQRGQEKRLLQIPRNVG